MFYVFSHKNRCKHRFLNPKLSQYCYYSLVTILWKFRILNPMFTPIFMTEHVKQALTSRPIKFYVYSHKNGCKHRIFHPILSQYCSYTIMTIFWKFRIENQMFTPIFMLSHVKFYRSWYWCFFYVSEYKNGSKHRIFNPKLSKYCYYSIIIIL